MREDNDGALRPETEGIKAGVVGAAPRLDSVLGLDEGDGGGPPRHGGAARGG